MSKAETVLQRPGGLCRLCGATTRQRRVLREDMTGWGQWLIECGHCRALYLDPDFTPDGLRRFYADDYRKLYPFETCPHPDETFLRDIRCREIGLRRARALARFVPPQGRILEIGSGHGGFLAGLHRLRPDIALGAVEFDRDHRELALDGVPVRFLSWEEIAQVRPFHLIALFHTLEHLPDPVDTLKTLRPHLEEDGRIVVEVPATVPEALSSAEIHPAHLSYFTPATLHRACLAAGLSPIPAEARTASLPGCLWQEARRDGPAMDAPSAASNAIAPPRRHAAIRAAKRCFQAAMPPSLRGALSRWRHGPGLDDALAEAAGRIFRWGIGFDRPTMDDLLRTATAAMEQRTLLRIADVNVAKLIALRSDANFRMAVQTADRVVVDGMGILWGLQALKADPPERIAGIDFLDRIAGLCAERGFSLFIVGAKNDVLERAIVALEAEHPGLRIAGRRDGYFREQDLDGITRDLAESKADCLVVALPYPCQDLFLAQVHAASGIPLAFGVGGSLDVLSGDRKRAPRRMQCCGLEWLYRLLQEPCRLGPRYIASNTRFLLLLLSSMIARWLA